MVTDVEADARGFLPIVGWRPDPLLLMACRRARRRGGTA